MLSLFYIVMSPPAATSSLELYLLCDKLKKKTQGNNKMKYAIMPTMIISA